GDSAMSSSDAIRELISRHNQVRRECQEIDTRVKAQNRQYWNNRVGPVSDVLSQSRDEAEKCLHHSDAAIRSAALNALFYDHKAVSDPSFVRSCERLAFKDPDPEVRANALGFMAFFHQASSDLRIGRLLAQVVCDESLVADV